MPISLPNGHSESFTSDMFFDHQKFPQGFLLLKVPKCWNASVGPQHHSSQMQGKVNKNIYSRKIDIL